MKINPYYPDIHRNTASTNTPIKILIHGYGGLIIDYTIKNISAAYRSAGYSTIIGISTNKTGNNIYWLF